VRFISLEELKKSPDSLPPQMKKI